MDYDVLLRLSRAVVRGVLSQDTTDFWETLDPDVSLIVNDNPSAGDIRTCLLQLAASWDDNIQLKKRQLETALHSKTMLSEERRKEQAAIDQMVNRPRLELSDLGGLGVELARGAEDVGRATLSLFEWMHRHAAKTGGIAHPTARQEVRRRKDGAGKTGGGAGAGPSGGLVSTARQRQLREEQLKAQAEAEAAGRTLEGKLAFSFITLTYGLPHMLVRDEMFVHEDNKVALIIRTPLPAEDGFVPEVLRMRDVAVMDPTGGTKLGVQRGRRSDDASGSLSSSGSARGAGAGATVAARTQSPRNRAAELPIAAGNNHGGGAVVMTPRKGAAAAAAAGGGGAHVTSSISSPGRAKSLAKDTITSATSTSVSGGGGVAASSTSGAGCSRVLDFSFKKIAEPFDLLRTEPAQYIRHLPAPVAKEAPKNLADEVRQQREAAKDGHGGLLTSGGKVNIMAKSEKTGEAQRYQFSIKGGSGGGGEHHAGDDGHGGLGGGGSSGLMAGDAKKTPEEIAFEQLCGNLRTKIVCDSVRICNNEMSEHADKLLPVLRVLVVNHYLRVQWLDLSNNKLQHIPTEISQMPLRALHLHGNQIEKWRSLEDELPRLTRLQHFTVFGNPIAENASAFRPRALALLLHVPYKMLPFKALDFVTLTLVDVQSAASYLRMFPRALDVTKPRHGGGAGPHHNGGGSPGRSMSPRGNSSSGRGVLPVSSGF